MGQKMPVVRVNLATIPDEALWFTVVTKYNYEKKFASDLQCSIKNLGLEDRILEVIVPIKEEKYIIKNKAGKEVEKIKEEKIYPSYVFVKAKMNEQVWDILRNTSGSANVMAASSCPLYIRDDEMDKIKASCGLSKKDNILEKFTGKIGDTVEIYVGPFQGYKGKVESIHKEKFKIILKLENGIPLEIELDKIRAI